MAIICTYKIKLGAMLKRIFLNPWTYVVLFILLGSLQLFLFYDMPIVRNSLVFAQIINAFIDFGKNSPVVKHAYSKALGFVYLSFPFVKLWGANIGLKVSSFLWTSLYVLFIIPFLHRLKSRQELMSPSLAQTTLAVIVTLFNPLLLYQFISAYPDTLFALSFLCTLYFLNQVFSEDIKWFDGPCFVTAALFSIWVKYHGYIILPIFLIFLFTRVDVIGFQLRSKRRELLLWIISSGLLLVLIGLILCDKLPIFHIEEFRVERNFDYSQWIYKWHAFPRSLVLFKDYLLLSFGILSPLLLWWQRFKEFKEWYLTIILFVFFTISFSSRGAIYNMRYFIPILPLLAWIIANNVRKTSNKFQIIIILIFLSINSAMMMYYNSISLNSFFNKHLPFKMKQYDNLRLTNEQKNTAHSISLINSLVNDRCNTLFFISRYYSKAAWHIWEREGLFSDDLKIVYGLSVAEAIKDSDFEEAILFLIDKRYRRELNHAVFAELFDITEMGDGVWLLKRKPRRGLRLFRFSHNTSLF